MSEYINVEHMDRPDHAAPDATIAGGDTYVVGEEDQTNPGYVVDTVVETYDASDAVDFMYRWRTDADIDTVEATLAEAVGPDNMQVSEYNEELNQAAVAANQYNPEAFAALVDATDGKEVNNRPIEATVEDIGDAIYNTVL